MVFRAPIRRIHFVRLRVESDSVRVRQLRVVSLKKTDRSRMPSGILREGDNSAGVLNRDQHLLMLLVDCDSKHAIRSSEFSRRENVAFLTARENAKLLFRIV